jgi:diacylglycerol kinase family enzyme
MSRAKNLSFESCTFLINPTRQPRYARRLVKTLARLDASEVIVTESRTHFIECVKRFYERENRFLFVWGGDGTAHDAINALMEASGADPVRKHRKAIGFLRGGSGNGIQDSYEVPFGLRNQIAAYGESVANNYTIDVDLLAIRKNDRTVYCQLAGVGFDVEVLKRRERRKDVSDRSRSRSGFLNYLVSVIETFFLDYRQIEREYTIELFDGKYAFRGTRVNAEFPIRHLVRTVKPLMIEAGTRPYYGRFFRVCPDVVCNDGNLDLYVFNFTNRRSIVKNAVSLWNGRHDVINKRFARRKLPLIERYEVKKVRIYSDRPFEYHIDGELSECREGEHEHNALEIEVSPHSITFIVPSSFYWKFSPFKEEPETAELADLT